MESSSPSSDNLPDSGDETMDKMACIEAMLNKMEHTPTASDVLIKRMTDLVNREDLQKMVELQTHMLGRFEKTNEMLLNFNALSLTRYDSTCLEFKRHTQLLVQMKSDLDSVFRRIRTLKIALNKLYPEAFKASALRDELREEDEETAADDTTQPHTDSDSSATVSHDSVAVSRAQNSSAVLIGASTAAAAAVSHTNTVQSSDSQARNDDT